mmetsp:Transcript_34405/g.107887  ORF Transcript_34405/g.107887 Transcript_34405/m.107887 type:complete len:88 (+) Transcript_34405:185-448(+)
MYFMNLNKKLSCLLHVADTNVATRLLFREDLYRMMDNRSGKALSAEETYLDSPSPWLQLLHVIDAELYRQDMSRIVALEHPVNFVVM